jgi:hypothetical protein
LFLFSSKKGKEGEPFFSEKRKGQDRKKIENFYKGTGVFFLPLPSFFFSSKSSVRTKRSLSKKKRSLSKKIVEKMTGCQKSKVFGGRSK